MNKSRRRRRPGYWRTYFRSRKGELKKVIEATRRLLKNHPDPWTRPRRGRPYGYPAKEMIVLCVLKAYLDQSYLDVEDLAPILLGISPDDNTIWRAMRRLGEAYVSTLAKRVAEECLGLRKAAYPVYVIDSTGLGEPHKPGIQGPKVKLHTLTLLPSNVVLASKVTLGSRHDSPVLRELLDGVWGPGLVLADSAYFSRENILMCLRRCLVLVVKPRKGLRNVFLRQYIVFFGAAWRAYRYRGVAEGVYGAMENRFGCRLGSRAFEAQVTEGLLHVYIHNLRALFKAQEASSILLAWISLSTMASTEDLWDNP